ncbi:hypothetical protein HOD20_04910 [archaeon]|jgi:hypothetical protein|nr:hypothetical protein [archaeon]MBT4351844.1 hypothetical protein [archaeon]MBT4647615.1 hypothetical protein [archaeon]MBT6822591.1 hypothetical protein [archaeon]MBT7392776.1 hypothetical protein [archaeon]
MSLRVNKKVQEGIKKRYKPLVIKKQHIMIAFIILIISFFIDIKRIIVLVALCVINTILLSLDRYISLPVDLEFSTFSAISFAIVYDLKWGLVAGILTKVVTMAYNANVRADHFFMMGGYSMAAVIAAIMTPGFNIITIGIVATIIVNIYIVFVSIYITNLYPVEIIMYGFSNFMFNIFLFVAFSEPLLFIMGL